MKRELITIFTAKDLGVRKERELKAHSEIEGDATTPNIIIVWSLFVSGEYWVGNNGSGQKGRTEARLEKSTCGQKHVRTKARVYKRGKVFASD